MERPHSGMKNQKKPFYDEWDSKDELASLLGNVNDGILCEFEWQGTTKGLWSALQSRFGVFINEMTKLPLYYLIKLFFIFHLTPMRRFHEH